MVTQGALIGGRYRVERTLGEGGMGVVVVATQLSLGRLVALKLLKVSSSATADEKRDAAERFKREVEVIGRLQHPNIVSVIDGGGEGDSLFLAMELLSGETLRQRIRRAPLAWPDVVALADDIASGLAAAHAAGVIHRDVKAENVMLVPVMGQRERAKLVDFGVAKLNAAALGAGGARPLTSPDAVPGTPGSIAPEQLRSVDDEPRSDLYALGVLMFEALSGRHPFLAPHTAALIAQHMTQPAPHVADVCADRRLDPVPAPVDAIVARLLEKDPARRPTAAELVLELRALGEATRTTSTDAVRKPSADPGAHEAHEARAGLVGRERELAVLDSALAEAERGRGACVLLVGDAGIGTSRLAEAVAARARDRADVCWGRAWEAGGAPALWLWSEALRALVATRQIDVGTTGVLAELLSGAPVTSGDLADARFRVFQAVDALLERACRDRAVVIVLEDVHVADAASLHLLQAVVRRVRARRLLVVATMRDGPDAGDASGAPAQDARTLLGAIARDATSLALGHLEHADVARLVQARTSTMSRVVPDAIVRAIHDATHGNPLFVTELVQLLDAQGKLTQTPTGPLPIPLGVRDAIRQRLDRLPGATRATLEVAATLGRRFDLRVLARAAGRDIDDDVDHAVRAGVLVEEDHGRAGFHHALFVDAIARELPAARRRELHGRAGDALAALGAPPAEVAHHMLEAGAGRASEAIETALVAADAALRRAAFEDAAAVMKRAGAALPADERRLRARVRIMEGRAVLFAGDEPAARALFQEAATEARALNDATLLAEAALGYGSRVREGEVLDDLVHLLEEALAALAALGDGQKLLRPPVLARLAAARQPALDPRGPVATALEAIALARATGDRVTLLHTLHDGLGALTDIAAPDVREPLTVECERLCEQLDDRVRLSRARLRSCWNALDVGDAQLLADRTARLAAVVEETRGPAWRIDSLRASLACMAGDYAGARAAAERVAAAGAQHPDAVFLPISIEYAFAHVDEARRMCDALVAILPPRGFLGAMRSGLASFGGDAAQDEPFLRATRHALWFPSEAMMAVPAAVRTRDVDALRAIVAAHRGQASRVVSGLGFLPIAAFLAPCARALGDDTEAEVLREEALATARRTRIPMAIARTAAAIARETRDAARARALLDEADAIAARHGMDTLDAPT